MSDFGSEFMSDFLKFMKRHNAKVIMTTREEEDVFYETIYVTQSANGHEERWLDIRFLLISICDFEVVQVE